MNDCSVCLFALSLVGVCDALTVQNYSIVSCDDTGNATLNTSEFYRNNKYCDWTLRDENDTLLEVVTPSANVSVSCNRSEVYLKVYCDSPKYENVHCYKLNRTKNEDGTPSHFGASHSRTHVFVLIPLTVFLILLICLAIYWKRQSPDAGQNNRESPLEV